jgi:hypothetical protein
MTQAPVQQEPAQPALSDEQIDSIWLRRPTIHNGDTTMQLRDFARAVIAAVPVQAAPSDLPNTPGDTLEDNVSHLLDKCPYTVRDMSGERTGMRGREDLAGSLAITFLGMQGDLAKRASSPPQAVEPVRMLNPAQRKAAFDAGWNRGGSQGAAEAIETAFIRWNAGRTIPKD